MIPSKINTQHSAIAIPAFGGFRWLGLIALCATLSGCGGRPQQSTAGDEKNQQSAKKSPADPHPIQKPSSKALSPPEVPEVIRRPSESRYDPAESEPEPSPLAGRFQPDVSPPSATSKLYRPSDDRPPRDEAALAELGIKRYASKHLELYSDIKPELAKDLPPLVDQLYVALEKYFGPLPPDREGSTFQMTGYIMADQRVFRETGLLPEDLPGFNHGRHRGAEFWMNDQEYDYYLRHLMLHEATHCFMTITRRQNLLPPVWYMEGMAELFGTHSLAPDGTATFRVMPDHKEAFAGLGRISLIQAEVKKNRFRSLDEVLELTPNDYADNEAYAWSWALCKFLDTHPSHREAFRKLGKAPTRRSFVDQFYSAYQADLDDLRTEWALFAHHLEEGYQIEPAAIDFVPGKPLTATDPQTTLILKADRGWQSSGVFVEQGKKYTLAATGRFTLGQTPKPWVSEPEGISFRYFDGQPLGKLLGCIRTETPTSITTAQSMRQVFPCGANQTFIAPQTGTLYLRLNDAWNELKDNTGTVTVQVRLSKAK